MSREDELAALCEYYKELAHRWEVACHDFRALTSSYYSDPKSYKKAVALAARRPPQKP